MVFYTRKMTLRFNGIPKHDFHTYGLNAFNNTANAKFRLMALEELDSGRSACSQHKVTSTIFI